MATTITNQATLTYNFGTQTATAESNIATAILQGPITAEKSSLDTDYTEGEDITYFVNLTNSSESALTNVTVTDDLGTYAVSPTLSVTPLTYTGPAQLFINGIPTTVLVPTVTASSVTFTIPSLSSGDNALITYKATVNGNAPLATASTVENTVSVTADGIVETVTDSHILTVENYADVEIVKAMSPSTVTDGSTLTYSFEIFNYGNTDATNVVLTDAFSPAPTQITVTVNGDPIQASEYSYVNGVLTLPTQGAATSITVPAATFTQDPSTGEFTTVPGTVSITVSGTI